MNVYCSQALKERFKERYELSASEQDKKRSLTARQSHRRMKSFLFQHRPKRLDRKDRNYKMRHFNWLIWAGFSYE